MPTWKSAAQVEGAAKARAAREKAGLATRGMLNPRYVTLDPPRAATVFIVWQTGHRLPRSYHLDIRDAEREVERFITPGAEFCILEARVTRAVQAARTLTSTEGEGWA